MGRFKWADAITCLWGGGSSRLGAAGTVHKVGTQKAQQLAG